MVNKGGSMLSLLPVDLAKVDAKDLDREILRAGMIAELDAVSFYEQLAAMTKSEDLRKVLADIATEEKTHMGEFQTLLLKLDESQKKELEEGRREVEELLEK
jgi:rubrerythrin